MACFARARSSLCEPENIGKGLDAGRQLQNGYHMTFLSALTFPERSASRTKNSQRNKSGASAQKEASMQPQSLRGQLARTANEWGRNTETIELLCGLLAKNDDTKLVALQALYHQYVKLGDTAGLYRTILRLAEALPNDLGLQKNLAQISPS